MIKSEAVGYSITTARLLLLPANNERDNTAFLKMLTKDGDLEIYCGAKPTEENIRLFNGYLEQPGFFAVYLKEQQDRMIGYIGLTVKEHAYDLEFYISKPMRRKGYCAEAFDMLYQCIQEGKMSLATNVDENRAKIEVVTASTYQDSDPARRFLESVGFEQDTSFVMVMMISFQDDGSMGADKAMVQYKKQIQFI